MKVIKTAKAVKAQMYPLDTEDEVHYTGKKSPGYIDVEDVKIGDDLWYFYIDGEAIRNHFPIEDVIVSARKWDQEFNDGKSAIMELQKNPGYEENFLWDAFAEELAQFEDERRMDNLELKHKMGPYENMEEPDYGPDPVYPEY